MIFPNGNNKTFLSVLGIVYYSLPIYPGLMRVSKLVNMQIKYANIQLWNLITTFVCFCLILRVWVWACFRNVMPRLKESYANMERTRSLGPLRGPTSSLRPFGPALGPSGLLDFVLRALRALRPCDPRPHPSQAITITRMHRTS